MTISTIYSRHQLYLKDRKLNEQHCLNGRLDLLWLQAPLHGKYFTWNKTWSFHLQGTLSLSWVQQGNCSSSEWAIAVVWNNESSCVPFNYVRLHFLYRGPQRHIIGHPKFKGLQTIVATGLLQHTLDFKTQRANIRHVQPPYHLPKVFIEVIIIPPWRVRGCSIVIWICLL